MGDRVNLTHYWDDAMGLDDYLEQMTQNRDLFERRIRETEIGTEERERFSGAPLRVLALTEDFCGDSAQFIPPIARLAQELENVELRLLLRDQHRELASNYRRKDGYQAIPVLIVLDAEGDELGFLIERPQRTCDVLAAETRRFVQANPQLEGGNRTYDKMPPETRRAIRANADSFRDGQQTEWTRWLFEDLAGIVAAAHPREAAHAAD
jgi:hypothetical protein